MSGVDPFSVGLKAPDEGGAADPFMAGLPKGTGGDPFQTGHPLTGGSDPFSVGLPGTGTQPNLEAAAKSSGASTFLSGLGTAATDIADILSRPNYAIAGATQELLQGHGLEDAIARAGQEFFSGVAGLHGKKERFGQVLEQAGVGTGGSLSDVLPFLYSDTGDGLAFKRHGILDPTARGLGGFALDVVTDPLTYLTFGGAEAGRVTLKSGTRFLSKEGLSAWNDVRRAILDPAIEAAAKIEDPALRVNELLKARSAAMDAFESQLVDRSGAILKPAWIDKGGAKLFGHTVIPKDAFDTLGHTAVRTMMAFPGGEMAVEAATASAKAIRASLASVFSAFPKLSDLPEGIKSAAIRLHRDAESTAMRIDHQLFQEWASIAKDWEPLAKAAGGPQALGKMFYDLAERTGKVDLTEAQSAVYQRVIDLYNRLGDNAVKLGIMDEGQLRKSIQFMHHNYLNPEALDSWTAAIVGSPATEAKFTRARAFETYKDAVDVTSRESAVTEAAKKTGQVVGNFPVLQPDYDVMNNLAAYIKQYADAVSRKQWRESAVKVFGNPIGALDLKSVYDLTTPGTVSASWEAQFAKILRNHDIDAMFGREAGLKTTVGRFEISHAPTQLPRKGTSLLDETSPEWKAANKKLEAATRERDTLSAALDAEEAGSSRAKSLGTSLKAADKRMQKAQAAVDRLQNLPGERGLLTETHRREINKPPLASRVERAYPGWTRFVSDSRVLLKRSTPDEKKEFFRQLFTRVKSPAQFAQATMEFQDLYKFFPRARVVAEGTVEPMLSHYGEGARYVARSGGMWGDTPVMLPKAVVDDIENFTTKLIRNREIGPGLRKVINGYDFLNNWFKTAAYTFWPAAATRDQLNNVEQAFLDIGIGALARPIDTAKILSGKGTVRVLGRDWDAKVLKALADDVGITDKTGRVFAQLEGSKQFSPTGKFAKVVAARAQLDNFTRVQHWVNNMARGLDPWEAADKVREFLFAYNELSPFERTVMRRLIPFYTYSRKSIGLHLRALSEQPGKLANELKMFRGRDDENGMMTSWDGQAFKLRLNRDGQTLTVLNGIDLPVSATNALWRGSVAKTFLSDLGMISPVLKFPVEIGTTTDLFTGRQLARKRSDAMGRFIDVAAPKLVKDWLGYSKGVDAAGRPEYTFDAQRFYALFQSWALSRVVSTSDRQFREYLKPGEEGAAGVLLDVLTGMRLQKMNLSEEQAKMKRERERALQQALVRRGVMREHTSVYFPRTP